jgi:hypothetical protein
MRMGSKRIFARIIHPTINSEGNLANDLEEAITKHIELEEVVFENELVLSDNGKLVKVPGNGAQYVGEPSVAIDDAWQNLLIGAL